MAYSIANNQLLRKHFQEIKRIIDIPNLIDIQKNSYQRFLQADGSSPVIAAKCSSGLLAIQLRSIAECGQVPVG